MTEEIQKNKNSGTFLLIWDRLLDTFDKIAMQLVTQFTSGRWILTVAAAVVMVKVCWNNMDQVKEFKEIIAVIIYAYFQRGDRNGEQKSGGSNVSENNSILQKPNQEPTGASV